MCALCSSCHLFVTAPLASAQSQQDQQQNQQQQQPTDSRFSDQLDDKFFTQTDQTGDVDPDILADTKSFFDTGLGKMLVQAARVMAVLLGIWSLLKFGAAFFSRNQAGGGLGRALGPAVIAFIAAGLLLNLGWTAALLSWFTSFVGKVFEAIGELIF